MAKKNDEFENQEPGNMNISAAAEMKKIEYWKVELGTKNYVYAGAKLHNNWADGKSLTRSEYESGIKNFLGAPAGGK